MDAKICGVKDFKTLKYITSHNHPPKFIGFVTNYLKSKRYIPLDKLKKLTEIEKKGIKFVSVLVNPDENILDKIKNFKFDYYQLYDVNPEKTKFIKEEYNKKIISALTIEKKVDVEKYKEFEFISDVILFDSKGYEKSVGFDHALINDVPNSITRMLAGNIKYDESLDKYSKIADIIDISGSLETSGEKDISKIDIFLKNINNVKNAN